MKHLKIILFIFLLFSIICFTTNGQNKSNLVKIFEFNQNETGFPSLCSNDDSIFVDYSLDGISRENGLYWVKNGKRIKIIDSITDNFKYGQTSPDGNYYSYVLNDVIYINNKNKTTIATIPTPKEEFLDSVVWSFDSKTLYFCQLGDFDTIYSYNITTEKKREILRIKEGEKQYLSPITVKNKNVIYLLENSEPSDPIPSCEILRYDLLKKELTKIELPKLKNFGITDDYTISPDEKIIMFNNIWDGNKFLYVIDRKKVKVIEKIDTPPSGEEQHNFCYSWKSDSSYVIFTMTGKEIYKYTIPKY